MYSRLYWTNFPPTERCRFTEKLRVSMKISFVLQINSVVFKNSTNRLGKICNAMYLNHGGFAGAVSTSDNVNARPRLQHKAGVTHEVFKLDLGDRSQGKSRARGFSVARQCPRELCGGAAIIVTRLPAFKRIHDGLQNTYYVRIF